MTSLVFHAHLHHWKEARKEVGSPSLAVHLAWEAAQQQEAAAGDHSSGQSFGVTQHHTLLGALLAAARLVQLTSKEPLLQQLMATHPLGSCGSCARCCLQLDMTQALFPASISSSETQHAADQEPDQKPWEMDIYQRLFKRLGL